ncbi:NADH-ubiquinone oxidoreductase-F iron-sulfur binding region domain-containing protein [Conexibacter sp. DBS9H8]|uniref:NADH-ubiquinone oxidoreductase-F iron-sulfur binding region domain-containing protein n=1 Tax=Conexibacter sp. DBS9H8 TaxID=2937801 RepID=UPI00200FB78F|nr:NADH-ubiquinone oxidoreductase-F iron-sulfur binding region domain-containing protein [Conexibacter sp. DBS9H8]
MPSRPPRRMNLNELVDSLERARLHGHGGAYFPTGTKLRAVASQRRRPIVVVNGTEGEPLSRKDRFLLSARTDVVLDGAFCVAHALGADAIVVGVDHRRVQVIDALEQALAGRPELADRGAPVVEVIGVPDGFVSGQETALINFLNGLEAKPTTTPPYPFEKGLRGRPTLVSNAETYAQIGRIVAGRFDGSRHVTVAGAVPRTTVVSVRPGTTVAAALTAAGGVTEPISAILLGGYGGTWAAAAPALELPLDEPTLRAEGLTLGAGIIFALGSSDCGVSEVARVTRWMADQTAGQCGPCVFGLDAIAGALEDLCAPGLPGRDRFRSLAQVQRWCAMVNKRGGCAHPDGVSRYVTSALSVMAHTFSDHAGNGPCDRCEADYRAANAPLRRSVRTGQAVPV